MRNGLVETLIGTGVLAVAAIFLVYAYSLSDSQAANGGYALTAKLSNASGITTGTDVRISGIKVGTVISNDLDPVTYDAVVKLRVRNDIELPSDTALTVSQDGLLGGNFISLQPGGDFENLLQDGDQIYITQGTLDLISLVSQVVFGSGASGGGGDDGDGESAGE